MIGRDVLYAYIAATRSRLRGLEDQWTWDTTQYEKVVEDVRQLLLDLDKYGRYQFGIDGWDAHTISWGRSGGGKATLNTAGAEKLVKRWKDGEFDND